MFQNGFGQKSLSTDRLVDENNKKNLVTDKNIKKRYI
jgi:hypothetical protein